VYSPPCTNRPTLLDFGDQIGTGMSNVARQRSRERGLWPMAKCSKSGSTYGTPDNLCLLCRFGLKGRRRIDKRMLEGGEERGNNLAGARLSKLKKTFPVRGISHQLGVDNEKVRYRVTVRCTVWMLQGLK
jgi:hypothetical protein